MVTISADPIDHIYDAMRTDKVFIHQGMDSCTEFMEGLPLSKRRLLTTLNEKALTLDEWASQFHVDTSTLIAKLNAAIPVGQRKEHEEDQLDGYHDLLRIRDDPQTVIEREEVEVINEAPLLERQKKVSPSFPKAYPHSPTCPKCGEQMQIKHGKHGDFWGCLNYPECKGTVSTAKAKQQGHEPPKSSHHRPSGFTSQTVPPPPPPPRKPPHDRRPEPGDGDWWGNGGLWVYKIGVVLIALFAAYGMIKLGGLNGGFFGFLLRLLGIALVVGAVYLASKKHSHVKQALQSSAPMSGDKDRVHDSFLSWFKDKLHSWKAWLIVGSISISLMGIVGISEFMYEEAGQSAGLACYVLKTAGLAEETMIQVGNMNELLDQMESFVNTFGWLSPFSWDAFKTWIKASRQNADAMRLWAIAQNPQLAEAVMTAEVISVIDGDSLMLSTGEEIRLSGINAPEWYAEGGREAAAMLRGLVLHQVVDIRRINQGYYGRIIADISINGQDVSTALVKAGLAKAVSESKIVEVDGAEGVVTKIISGRILNGGYLLLTGEPCDVFVLPDAAEGIPPKSFNGLMVEAAGKLKLYNGEPEVIVDDGASIKIVQGG